MTQPNDPINIATNDAGEIFHYTGLTKREYFAAMAMQALLSMEDKGLDKVKTAEEALEILSAFAVSAADSLINALNKPQSNETP